MLKRPKLFSALILVLIIMLGSACSMKQPSVNKELSEDTALSLITKAEGIFRYLSNGGNDALYENGDYSKRRITDERINSKEKIISLLQTVYSSQLSEKIYTDTLKFYSENGYVYQPNFEFIYTKDWSKANIKRINNKGDVAVVIVEVPEEIGEECIQCILSIEFIYEKADGWKLNSLIY